LGLDSLGEVLYQNHPLDLEQISAAEADAMVASMSNPSTAATPSVAAVARDSSSDNSSSSSSSHGGLTDALAALLGKAGTAVAAAAGASPSTAEALGQLPKAVGELLNAEIGTAAPGVGSQATSSSSSSSSSNAAVVDSPTVSDGAVVMDGQQSRDTYNSSSSNGSTSAVASLPALNHDATAAKATADASQSGAFTFSKNNITQVVITSFKMNPVTVEQLAKIAGPGEAAVAWQDSLQDTLSNATANATGVPEQQVQTKISSVLNLVSAERDVEGVGVT
jgi:hypothetical protein